VAVAVQALPEETEHLLQQAQVAQALIGNHLVLRTQVGVVELMKGQALPVAQVAQVAAEQVQAEQLQLVLPELQIVAVAVAAQLMVVAEVV
jgi:hypothetical protein